MSPSGQPQGTEQGANNGVNGQVNPMSVYSNTLPKPRPPPPNLMTPGMSGNGTTTGGFPQHHHHLPLQPSSHHFSNPGAVTSPYQTLHHPKSNYVKDYPPPSHYHPHHSLPPQQQQQHHSPPNDYNTIYIRDKLLHDSDIPESCVWDLPKTYYVWTKTPFNFFGLFPFLSFVVSFPFHHYYFYYYQSEYYY